MVVERPVRRKLQGIAMQDSDAPIVREEIGGGIRPLRIDLNRDDTRVSPHSVSHPCCPNANPCPHFADHAAADLGCEHLEQGRVHNRA